MARLRLALMLMAFVVAAFPAPARGQQPEEAAIRALLQEQAAAFNRGDLDAAIATHSSEVNWLSISGEWIQGRDALRTVMSGWMEGTLRAGRRLVYPTDSLSIQVLSSGHAVADLVVLWEDASHLPVGSEKLFYVFEREPGGWVVRDVRNTTRSWRPNGR